MINKNREVFSKVSLGDALVLRIILQTLKIIEKSFSNIQLGCAFDCYNVCIRGVNRLR